jgi:mRNA-degrading endonuclease RelE of RelBE toxin-antitoxin system
MNNTVSPTPEFKRNIKPLAKKYSTLRQTIEQLERNLISNPYLGESYGSGIYKVRISDISKGKGKSGGFRVIYYHLNKTDNGIDMLLLSIFDKSERSTINKDEAIRILSAALKEI